MSRRDIAGPFLALLLLSALPGSACAQVFIASHPQPEFSIGPLFVSASVGKPNVVGNPGALTVSVSWSLTLAPHRRAADIAQDLYLLWPGEVVGTAGAADADPMLVRQVEALGFKVKAHGRLRLSARGRTEMGTSAGLRTLGEAPFVAFARGRAGRRGARRHLHPDPLGTRVGKPGLARPARPAVEGGDRPAARELGGGHVLGAAVPHHARLRRCGVRVAVSALLRSAGPRRAIGAGLLHGADQLCRLGPPQGR